MQREVRSFMKKRISYNTKLIGAFLLVALVGIIITGLIAIRKSEDVLESNMIVSSNQTIDNATFNFQTFTKTLSLPVDLLTRKDAVRLLQQEDNFDKYIANVQDELVAATKVIPGAVRAYYATESGTVIYGWIEYDESGKKISKNKIVENNPLSGEEWYQNCQGRSARPNQIFSYFTKPYKDAETGKDIITVCQEVKTKNVVQGVVAMDVEVQTIQDYLNNTKILETGFVELVDESGTVLIENDADAFSNGSMGNEPFWEELSQQIQKEQQKKDTLSMSENEEDKAKGEEMVVRANTVFEADNTLISVNAAVDAVTGWRIVGFVSETENKDNVRGIRTAINVAILVGIAVSIFLGAFFSRDVMKEIRKIMKAVETVAQNDFTQPIIVKRQDELGELERNFNEMLLQVSSAIHEVGEKSEQIIASSDEINEIAVTTQSTMTEVTQAIGNVASGAEKQAESTNDASNQTMALSESLDETNSYVDEIGEKAKLATSVSADGLRCVSDLIEKANSTSENAKVSLNVMEEMIESINKIFYISDAIAGITAQTNLLSLNASIEAARAGEMGRGFSVVADEIRQLADQSKESTDEIKEIIAEITDKSKLVEKTMKESETLQSEQQEAISQTEQIFNNIIKQIEELSSGMEHINELNSNMVENKDLVLNKMDIIAAVSEESAEATNQVNQSTEQVNETMQDITEHSKNLQTIAREMEVLVNKFKIAESDNK